MLPRIFTTRRNRLQWRNLIKLVYRATLLGHWKFRQHSVQPRTIRCHRLRGGGARFDQAFCRLGLWCIWNVAPLSCSQECILNIHLLFFFNSRERSRFEQKTIFQQGPRWCLLRSSLPFCCYCRVALKRRCQAAGCKYRALLRKLSVPTLWETVLGKWKIIAERLVLEKHNCAWTPEEQRKKEKKTFFLALFFSTRLIEESGSSFVRQIYHYIGKCSKSSTNFTTNNKMYWAALDFESLYSSRLNSKFHQELFTSGQDRNSDFENNFG